MMCLLGTLYVTDSGYNCLCEGFKGISGLLKLLYLKKSNKSKKSDLNKKNLI